MNKFKFLIIATVSGKALLASGGEGLATPYESTSVYSGSTATNLTGITGKTIKPEKAAQRVLGDSVYKLCKRQGTLDDKTSPYYHLIQGGLERHRGNFVQSAEHLAKAFHLQSHNIKFEKKSHAIALMIKVLQYTKRCTYGDRNEGNVNPKTIDLFNLPKDIIKEDIEAFFWGLQENFIKSVGFNKGIAEFIRKNSEIAKEQPSKDYTFPTFLTEAWNNWYLAPRQQSTSEAIAAEEDLKAREDAAPTTGASATPLREKQTEGGGGGGGGSTTEEAIQGAQTSPVNRKLSFEATPETQDVIPVATEKKNSFSPASPTPSVEAGPSNASALAATYPTHYGKGLPMESQLGMGSPAREKRSGTEETASSRSITPTGEGASPTSHSGSERSTTPSRDADITPEKKTASPRSMATKADIWSSYGTSAEGIEGSPKKAPNTDRHAGPGESLLQSVGKTPPKKKGGLTSATPEQKGGCC